MTNQIEKTTCPYCGVGCGVVAKVNAEANIEDSTERRALEVQGDKSHSSNLGRLCSKGSALADTVGLETRLLYPEVNGLRASWDQALDTVAEGFSRVIREHGPDAVAFYLSGQLLTEDYYVANKLMKGFIGSANVDTNSRLCMSSSVMGHKRAFGTDTVPGCYEDFEQAELIVLVGSNTAWCHPVLFQRIRACKEANPNLKIVVVDPRRTQTVDIADLHLPIAPGTDTWLFNGLLHFLSQHNSESNRLFDEAFLEHHVEGLAEALAEAAKSSGSIEKTASACDVDPRDLATFFQWFADTEKTVTLYSSGVHQSSSGTDKVNSILNCHLATGRIGRTGMGPFSMTGQPNAMGGREVGGMATTLAAHMDFTPDNVDRLNRFWQTDKVPAAQGLPAVELFDAIHRGDIKAVWIMATNPAVSLPDADKVVEALKKCELVVVSDCVRDTDTARLATVKLPATGWSEKSGTVTSSERLISRQRALFSPAGEARHDWQIITDVARRMGFKESFNYESAAAIFREHARLSGFENTPSGKLRDFDISGCADISDSAYDQLEPFHWPRNAAFPSGRKRLFDDGVFYTSNSKAQVVAITPRTPRNLPDSSAPLVLNSGRVRDQWHTMTRTALAPQLNQHISEPFVEIHPEDARRRNLAEGEIARINSQWGSMLARVIVTDNMRAGEVFAPMHWTDVQCRNARVCAVVNPVVDPVCFQPESKHTPVEVDAYSATWHACVMSREAIDWPAAEYLVEVRNEHYSAYELADSHSFETAGEPVLDALQYWLHCTESDQVLSYEDEGLGIYRIAVINASGALTGLVMFSRSQQYLPERSWLGMQFAKPALDARARAALLSGMPPAGEDIGKIICACYSVGEKTICQSIRDNGLTDVKQIGERLKAGTNCGSCIPELKELLASETVVED